MTQAEKQGAWVDCGRDNDYNKYYRCPHCDHEIIMYQGCRRTFPNFCEECGFDMKTQEKTDNQMKELKPCPFCGGRAGLDINENSYGKYINDRKELVTNTTTFHVVCFNCLARTMDYQDSEDAEIAWNRRSNRETD